jgi:hypothetical protein
MASSYEVNAMGDKMITVHSVENGFIASYSQEHDPFRKADVPVVDSASPFGTLIRGGPAVSRVFLDKDQLLAFLDHFWSVNSPC